MLHRRDEYSGCMDEMREGEEGVRWDEGSCIYWLGGKDRKDDCGSSSDSQGSKRRQSDRNIKLVHIYSCVSSEIYLFGANGCQRISAWKGNATRAEREKSNFVVCGSVCTEKYCAMKFLFPGTCSKCSNPLYPPLSSPDSCQLLSPLTHIIANLNGSITHRTNCVATNCSREAVKSVAGVFACNLLQWA